MTEERVEGLEGGRCLQTPEVDIWTRRYRSDERTKIFGICKRWQWRVQRVWIRGGLKEWSAKRTVTGYRWSQQGRGGREGERERDWKGGMAWMRHGWWGVGIWNHQEEGRCERLGAEGGGEGEKGFRWCGR